MALSRSAKTIPRLHGTAAMSGPIAVIVAIYVLSTLPTPLYVTYRQAFGFSQVVLTIAYAIYVLGALATMFFLGRLSDQIGRRPVALAAAALGCLATVVLLCARSTAWLLVGRVVSGGAVALATGACAAWLVELHPDADEARATRIAIGANLFGLGVGPLLGGLLAEHTRAPLRIPYAALLPLLAAAMVVAAFCEETVEEATPLARASLKPRIGVPEKVRGAFVFPAVGAFATFAVLGFNTALLPSVLRGLGERDRAVAGAIVAGLFFAGAAAVAATARVGARSRMSTGAALLLPAIALLVVAQATKSTALLVVATAFAGVGSGLGYGAGLEIVNDIAPDDQRSELISSYLIVCYAAISLPVVGIGLVASATSSMAADAIFAAVVALVVVAALVFGVRRGKEDNQRSG